MEALALDYLGEPRPSGERPESPRRRQLRQQILQRLTCSFFDVVLGPEGEAQGQWRDGELEKLFRCEARRMGHLDDMKQAMGGTAAVVEEGAQELLLGRGARHAADATLLSGLLGEWSPARGSLSTLLSQMVRSHLLDMHRRFHSEQGLSPVSGADRQWAIASADPDDDADDPLDRFADPAAESSPQDGLYEALELLPPRLRELVLVQLRGGSRDEELAAAGVLSPATLERRRQEAIDALREPLQAQRLVTQWFDRLKTGA